MGIMEKKLAPTGATIVVLTFREAVLPERLTSKPRNDYTRIVSVRDAASEAMVNDAEILLRRRGPAALSTMGQC